MRAFAWFLLLIGPVASLPVAAGLWAHAHPVADLGELTVLFAMLAAVLIEGAALRRRGLARQVAILLLSGLWVGWAWLALTQPGYDWTALPAWRMPKPGEQMIIILGVLAYLMLYEIAETAPRARGRSRGQAGASAD